MTRPDETLEERIQRKLAKKQRAIRVARGDEKADLVLKDATYLSVFSGEFCRGDIAVSDGLIVGMGVYEGAEEIGVSGRIVCPGFIDAHIHLESAMVLPAEFARAAVAHGTTTVIADPHEIANVMGTDGIDFMMEASERLPLDVHFMLPSCVPATPLDEAGAELDWKSIDRYYDHPRVLGLAEMMDYPGVTGGSAPVISKILGAQAHHKKIDGHAPGLSGRALNAYVTAGVYSDHECDNPEEALEKLRRGQVIMVRQGTAAKNLRALRPLLCPRYAARLMFATDDKHPGDLLGTGHIDAIVREAAGLGVDPLTALTIAGHTAARYFLLNNKGAIAPGYLADFAVLDSLDSLDVKMVIKKGRVVFDGAVLPFPRPRVGEELEKKARDTFHIGRLSPDSLARGVPLGLIGMRRNDIATDNLGFASAIDAGRDILKICVAERHRGTGHLGVGYLSGYGLSRGAVATSVSHDSHNIIAVGASDGDIAFAVNRVAENRGGAVAVEDGAVRAELLLPYAGLMSDSPLEEAHRALERLIAQARAQGVHGHVDPVMSLSFMSLSVIPELRVTTKGVFDVLRGAFV